MSIVFIMSTSELVSQLINMNQPHHSWHHDLAIALHKLPMSYLQYILENQVLPHHQHILAAFTSPKPSISHVLIGESPYPRASSANGFAFWDNQVTELWSNTGLATSVNKATSLRNIIKMLLHAEGYLHNDYSQKAISRIDKNLLINTLPDLFNKLLEAGFLLLNASLTISPRGVKYDAKHWRPFLLSILATLKNRKLILLGNFAKSLIHEVPEMAHISAEHPYNISFITNADVLQLFTPLQLMSKKNARE